MDAGKEVVTIMAVLTYLDKNKPIRSIQSAGTFFCAYWLYSQVHFIAIPLKRNAAKIIP